MLKQTDRYNRFASIAASKLTLLAMTAAAALAFSASAEAVTQSYSYKVEHPSYGDIGTYVESIDAANGVMHIDAQLHVAVKILGMVAYREDSVRKETWHDGRLLTFDSVTEKNGKHIEVRGSADHDGFVLSTPSGAIQAPANVMTSDPRVIKKIGAGMVISGKNGALELVDVTGGEPATIALQGAALETRHYRVNTEQEPGKWEIWLDGGGVPIKFRSMEDGTPIEFLLTSTLPSSTLAQGAAPTAPIQAAPSVQSQPEPVDARGGRFTR
jgi:hypothetical protein